MLIQHPQAHYEAFVTASPCMRIMAHNPGNHAKQLYPTGYQAWCNNAATNKMQSIANKIGQSIQRTANRNRYCSSFACCCRIATLHQRFVYCRPQLFLGTVDDRMVQPPAPRPTLSRAPRIAHAFLSGQEVMLAFRKPPSSAVRSDAFKSLRPMSDPAVDL